MPLKKLKLMDNSFCPDRRITIKVSETRTETVQLLHLRIDIILKSFTVVSVWLKKKILSR
jgi:hypothetical protein